MPGGPRLPALATDAVQPALLRGVLAGALLMQVALTSQAGVNGLGVLEFNNTATVTSSGDQFDANVTNNSSSVSLLPKGLQLTKTAIDTGISNPALAGNIIDYVIEATNHGLLPLSNPVISDDMILPADLLLVAGDTNADGRLEADETWRWTGRYLLTQADLDGNGGGDGDIDSLTTLVTDEVAPATAATATPFLSLASFSLSKTVDQPSLGSPGPLQYLVEVVNTGTLTLDSVVLNGTLPDGSSAVYTGPLTDIGQTGRLDSGETWQYTATYSVSQSEIDAGIARDASVTATTLQTGSFIASDSVSTLLQPVPSLSASKQVDNAAITAPGQLAYTIKINNDGTQTLTGVQVLDTRPDGSTAILNNPVNDTGVTGALDVGESWTFNTVYVVAQAEIDNGTDLTNRIDVTTNETGTDVVTAVATTTINQSPAFTVTEVVDQASISAPTTLAYAIEVSNTGNLSLTGVTIDALLPDGVGATLAGPVGDSNNPGVLDIGETWRYLSSYAVDQADIDSGTVLRSDVKVRTADTGATMGTAYAETVIVLAPVLQVEKTVDHANLSSPGALEYVISLRNNGNQTLSNIDIQDVMPDGSVAVLTGPLLDAGEPARLDVGELWEYRASYNVTQAEIDSALPRINTVTVTSTETAATPVVASATTTLTSLPAFEVTNVVDQPTATSTVTLNYTLQLRNTGNVSLTGVTYQDVLPDGSAVTLPAPAGDAGAIGILDVGEVWSWSTAYPVSQPDLDAGNNLVNTFTVATTEAGDGSREAVTVLYPAPALQIAKSSVDDSFIAAGDEVQFTIVATNTGNTQLDQVSVSDNDADPGSVNCTPALPALLAPAASVECTATITVTSAHLASGLLQNQASASATAPDGQLLPADSEIVSLALQQITPIAIDDSVVVSATGDNASLQLLSNDVDANGDLQAAETALTDPAATDTDADGDADRLLVVSEGVWQLDNNGLLVFTPEPGFSGDPAPVQYRITDATGLIALASASADYPQTAPVAQPDLVTNPDPIAPSNPTSINVVADNGAGADTDPENDLNLQSVQFTHTDAVDSDADGDGDVLLVPDEGEWRIDNVTGVVTFVPLPGWAIDPTPVGYRIADATGLLSNEALIEIDYPQSAPVAVDDQLVDQPLGGVVTVSVLDNDVDAEDDLLITSVELFVDTDEFGRELVVDGEGVWSVNDAVGTVSFTPAADFFGSPTPIRYRVADASGITSNLATVVVGYQEPVEISGVVWLDQDGDGVVDVGESRMGGWMLKLLDGDGNELAEIQTNSDGSFSFINLPPAVYTIQFFNAAGVFMDSASSNGVVEAGQQINLPLPVDPSGVAYDSLTRTPISGVTLQLTNSEGVAIDPSCLLEGQQGQTTLENGLYAFDIIPSAHPTCPPVGVYYIEIVAAPPEYHAQFSSIIRQVGATECGNPLLGCAVSSRFDGDSRESFCTHDALPETSACEVQAQAGAPVGEAETRYYTEFEIQAGDRNIIYNHLPLDSRANDAEILLSKQVGRGEVSVGGLISYSIVAENRKDVPAFAVEVFDVPPRGFSVVADSLRLQRAGLDGELDTSDDQMSVWQVEEGATLIFDRIDLGAEESVRLHYMLRVGAGVLPGTYFNRAYVLGPNGTAGNVVSAGVRVVADPVLQQSTLIGKVFLDRDRDGVQDSAIATGAVIHAGYFGPAGLRLPELPGREHASSAWAGAVTINIPARGYDGVRIATAEGSRISIAADGTLTEAHIGDRARGLSSQHLQVCTQRVQAPVTLRDGRSASASSDVVQVRVYNIGVDEPGLPLVRLASATGLIITTDSFGRFHIPDLDAGDSLTGRNVILKVDPASLPEGAEFTTENPYVLRISNTALNRANFGVVLPAQDTSASNASPCAPTLAAAQSSAAAVEVDLGSVFFNSGEHSIRDDQRGVVEDIIASLRSYGGGSITIQAHTDNVGSAADNLALAQRRARSLQQLLETHLGKQLMQAVEVRVDNPLPAGASQTQPGAER